MSIEKVKAELSLKGDNTKIKDDWDNVGYLCDLGKHEACVKENCVCYCHKEGK